MILFRAIIQVLAFTQVLRVNMLHSYLSETYFSQICLYLSENIFFFCVGFRNLMSSNFCILFCILKISCTLTCHLLIWNQVTGATVSADVYISLSPATASSSSAKVGMILKQTIYFLVLRLKVNCSIIFPTSKNTI